MKNFIRWIQKVWFMLRYRVTSITPMALYDLCDYPGEGTSPKGNVPTLFLLKQGDYCQLASQDKKGRYHMLTTDSFDEVLIVRAFQHPNGNILLASPQKIWEYFDGKVHELISAHHRLQPSAISSNIWIAFDHAPNEVSDCSLPGLRYGRWIELKMNSDGSLFAICDIHKLSDQSIIPSLKPPISCDFFPFC